MLIIVLLFYNIYSIMGKVNCITHANIENLKTEHSLIEHLGPSPFEEEVHLS